MSTWKHHPRPIIILAFALPVMFWAGGTCRATDWVYLPSIFKNWGAPPPLTVINTCGFTIWIQQSKEHKLTNTPLIQKIEAGRSFDYAVDPKGIISTRFWPKWGCDALGENCTWGQSRDGLGGPDDYAPCPAGGCHAPADSKLEVTWGCVYPNPATNPLCEHKKAETFYNGSAVDGYSLPFKITRSGDPGTSCQDIDCAGLNPNNCPRNDDLSLGKDGVYTEALKSVDLQIDLGNQEKACFSPCKKLNFPHFGGLGLNEQSDQVIMYCCPTPGVTSEQCNSGPVPATKYVTTVHTMCPNTYGFAYDDTLAGFNCHNTTKFSLTFCPGT